MFVFKKKTHKLKYSKKQKQKNNKVIMFHVKIPVKLRLLWSVYCYCNNTFIKAYSVLVSSAKMGCICHLPDKQGNICQ